MNDLISRTSLLRNIGTYGVSIDPYNITRLITQKILAEPTIDAADLIEYMSRENEILNAAIGQLGAIECHRDMLEHELEQVTRERDAAVRGLARYRRCIDCARYDKEVVTTNTLCDDCSFGSKWQWRGVEVDT